MKRLLIGFAAIASLFVPLEAFAHPACAQLGCFQRAGYSVQQDFDYIGREKIKNWNINYQRTHIQTYAGDIVLYPDGRVTSTNKSGQTISGSYYIDEYDNYVMYFDGWHKPVVLVNPIVY